MMRKLILCVVLIIAALGLAACRSSNEESAQYWFDSPVAHRADTFDLPLTGGRATTFGFRSRGDSAPPAPASAPAMPETADSGATAGQVDWEDVAGSGERHVIQTADVELHTEYFDDIEAALRQMAPAANGFVESAMSTTHGQRRFTIVMRVPAASFEAVLRQIEDLAYVRVLNQWAQDVTDQFYDMAGNYNIRRLEEERILALIEEAETVQELLALEQRLSNTRLVIERYLAQLNNMAGQIAYSTITVTLRDVSERPSDALAPTLGDRVGGAFGDSVGGTVRAVQNIIVFMAGAIVPLTLLGLIVIVVLFIVRFKKAKAV